MNNDINVTANHNCDEHELHCTGCISKTKNFERQFFKESLQNMPVCTDVRICRNPYSYFENKNNQNERQYMNNHNQQ
jgi:hypothetical protein